MITNQKRRKVQTDNIDWTGYIDNLSLDLQTDEGINKIIKKIDSFGRSGKVRELRQRCLIDQLKLVNYQKIFLSNFIDLIKNSTSYKKQDSWDNNKKLTEAIKWDIATLILDGGVGKFCSLNPVSSS